MTATPIPRTLALAGYGDLDTSTLRELPRGRQPIDTRIVAGERSRAAPTSELREQLVAGRQAFVVCPLIEEQPAVGAERDGAGAIGDLRAATAELERLRKGELRGHRARAAARRHAPAREAAGDGRVRRRRGRRARRDDGHRGRASTCRMRP